MTEKNVSIWKVEEFLIDNLKELPIGNGKFKIKAECSMQELLEKFENYMKENQLWHNLLDYALKADVAR